MNVDNPSMHPLSSSALTDRRAALVAQRDQLLAQVNMVTGAIALLDELKATADTLAANG